MGFLEGHPILTKQCKDLDIYSACGGTNMAASLKVVVWVVVFAWNCDFVSNVVGSMIDPRLQEEQ
jgi:hypothetical protein